MTIKKAAGAAGMEDSAKVLNISQSTKSNPNIFCNIEVFSGPCSFTLENIESHLATYAQATAHDYQVPLDWVIAAMGVITGAAAGAKITHHGKYVNSCALWLAIVADSGDGKSQMIKRLIKPLAEIDRELYYEYEKECEEWEAGGRKGREPTEKNIIEGDFTPESLQFSLVRNTDGIILYRDELSEFVSELARYNNHSVSGLLKWWDGTGQAIRRITKKTVRMPDFVHFSILGAVQPGVIGNELATRKMQILGFTHRWLWVTSSLGKPREAGDDTPPTDNSHWREFIQSLARGRARRLTFSPQAKRKYIEWYNSIEKERFISADGYEKEMLAKLEINCIRWMMARHLLSGAYQDTISEETAAAALHDMAVFRKGAMDVGAMCAGEVQLTNPQVFKHLFKIFPDTSKKALAEALNPKNPESLRTQIKRWVNP